MARARELKSFSAVTFGASTVPASMRSEHTMAAHNGARIISACGKLICRTGRTLRLSVSCDLPRRNIPTAALRAQIFSPRACGLALRWREEPGAFTRPRICA